jgi:hypothetical protein
MSPPERSDAAQGVGRGRNGRRWLPGRTRGRHRRDGRRRDRDRKGTDTASTIAGSAIGVIGSIVGAYLGVKLGGDQTRSAIEAQREEAVKAQVYAAHLPAGQAGEVVEMAMSEAEKVREKVGGGLRRPRLLRRRPLRPTRAEETWPRTSSALVTAASP